MEPHLDPWSRRQLARTCHQLWSLMQTLNPKRFAIDQRRHHPYEKDVEVVARLDDPEMARDFVVHVHTWDVFITWHSMRICNYYRLYDVFYPEGGQHILPMTLAIYRGMYNMAETYFRWSRDKKVTVHTTGTRHVYFYLMYVKRNQDYATKDTLLRVLSRMSAKFRENVLLLDDHVRALTPADRIRLERRCSLRG